MGTQQFGSGKTPAKVNDISTPKTASGIHVTGPAGFAGLIVKTDGTNNVTLNVFDNTAASGTRLIPEDTVVLGAARLWTLCFDPPIRCTEGVYVAGTVAAGAFAVQVVYDQG